MSSRFFGLRRRDKSIEFTPVTNYADIKIVQCNLLCIHRQHEKAHSMVAVGVFGGFGFQSIIEYACVNRDDLDKHRRGRAVDGAISVIVQVIPHRPRHGGKEQGSGYYFDNSHIYVYTLNLKCMTSPSLTT